MKRAKRTVLILAACLLLVSGTVTVCAVSAEGNRKEPAVSAGDSSCIMPEECLAEDMAIEAYVRGEQEIG